MRATLAGAAAAAFVAFGAVTPAATAADDPCPGQGSAMIVHADGSTEIVCIALRDEQETDANELLAKLVTALDARSFQERFDPTDVAAIQEVAKELGIDLDFSSASELSAILGSAVLGGHKSVLDVLKDGLAGMPGVADLGGATKDGLLQDTVLHTGGSAAGPTGPYMPDWSLYADGDPDEWEPYPGDSSGDGGSGSDAPLAEPSAPPLVAADPPLTPTDPPADGGPTDTDGPTEPEPSSNPADNPGNDWINTKIDENPKTAAVIGLVIQAIRLSTGGPPKMTDPDSTSADPGGPITPEQSEEIQTKLNRLKDPVNPDDVQQDPVDPSSALPGGGDPTVELHDGETVTLTIVAGSPADNLKISTAPIDPIHDPDGTLGGPPPGGPDSDTTHIAS